MNILESIKQKIPESLKPPLRLALRIYRKVTLLLHGKLFEAAKPMEILKAIINSIGNARENSLVISIK